MLPHFSCRAVSVSDFLPESSWDLHPYLPHDVTIFQSPESIKRAGLLYLPLVRVTTGDAYEFVTGKRCFDLSQSGTPKEKVFCRVLDPIPTRNLLTLLYEEHCLRRDLTAIEQAHFVQLCRNILPEPQQHELYADLGHLPKPQSLDRLTELLQLEDNLQYALMTGTITENMARDLLRLKSNDRSTFHKLAAQLHLGHGKQKRLLTLLRDITGRASVSFQECLAQDSLRTILHHPHMNVPQKTQVLFQLLQRLHSPALSGAEEGFVSWRHSLDLPPGCTVQHSPAFEQDTVSLTITFPNRHNLESYLEEIREHLHKWGAAG